MHNWFEMHVLGHEKVGEARRTAAQLPRDGSRGPEPRRPASLILARGEVMRLRVKRGSLRVTCRAGRMWLTNGRDGIDRLLQAGDTVTCEGRGTVVIEALRTATLRLESRDAMHLTVGAPLQPAFVQG